MNITLQLDDGKIRRTYRVTVIAGFCLFVFFLKINIVIYRRVVPCTIIQMDPERSQERTIWIRGISVDS